MAKFITLAGKKQVGKDTSARYIKELLPDRRVHIVHFADALKQACHAIFGIPLEDMETETGKRRRTDVKWPKPRKANIVGESIQGQFVTSWTPDLDSKHMTVREILQFVGTELFRTQMDPDVWVKSVYRKKYREDDVVVVADCRFPNEATFAKERGILIGVHRDTGLASDGHASEMALDNYDDYHYVVDNNGSFGELRMHLEAILVQQRFIG